MIECEKKFGQKVRYTKTKNEGFVFVGAKNFSRAIESRLSMRSPKNRFYSPLSAFNLTKNSQRNTSMPKVNYELTLSVY